MTRLLVRIRGGGVATGRAARAAESEGYRGGRTEPGQAHAGRDVLRQQRGYERGEVVGHERRRWGRDRLGRVVTADPRQHERERPAERRGQRAVGRRPVPHHHAVVTEPRGAPSPRSAGSGLPATSGVRPDAVATAATIAPAPGQDVRRHRDRSDRCSWRRSARRRAPRVDARSSRRSRSRGASRRRPRRPDRGRRLRSPRARAPRRRPDPRTAAPGRPAPATPASSSAAACALVRTSSGSAAIPKPRELVEVVGDPEARVVGEERDPRAAVAQRAAPRRREPGIGSSPRQSTPSRSRTTTVTRSRSTTCASASR